MELLLGGQSLFTTMELTWHLVITDGKVLMKTSGREDACCPAKREEVQTPCPNSVHEYTCT